MLIAAMLLVEACGGTASTSIEPTAATQDDEVEAQAPPAPDPCSLEPLDQTACFDHVRELAGDPGVPIADVLSSMQQGCAVRPRVVRSCAHVRPPLEPGSYRAASLFSLFCRQCAEDPESSSCGFDTRLAESRDAIADKCAQRDHNACIELLSMRETGCAADERDDALLANMHRSLGPRGLNRFYLIASPQPLPAGARSYDAVPRESKVVFGNLDDEGLQLASSDPALGASPFEGDGLPAISADGRFVAAGRVTGEGTAQMVSIAILRMEDLAVEQILELGGEDREELLSIPGARARARAHRRAARRAAQYLTRGRFRSLAPVYPPSGDPDHARGIPVLAHDATRLVLRDPGPGAVRWSGTMPADQSGLLAAAEMPEGCMEHAPEIDAYALPDREHVLLRAVYNRTRTECPKVTTFARVELAPTPAVP